MIILLMKLKTRQTNKNKKTWCHNLLRRKQLLPLSISKKILKLKNFGTIIIRFKTQKQLKKG